MKVEREMLLFPFLGEQEVSCSLALGCIVLSQSACT